MPVSTWMPWRSVWVPRALTAVALVIGVPLFLRSSPWCDITLYQLAARNILHGGTHYKELFDTNLPGFTWTMTALYAVFGFNVTVVRMLDLAIVFGVVALLDRLAKWAGATPAARWWTIAGAALFYPYTVEMSHAQRDTWMALPGLAALVLRMRRGLTPPGTGAISSPFRPAFVEGLLWGAGVWMKPHIALMAAGVWLFTARRMAGDSPRPWRTAGTDLLGNVLGGLVVGAAGVVWLVASGTWGPFVDVFTNWNPGYMSLALQEFTHRAELYQLYYFPPWSLCIFVTVPLALASVFDAAPWLNRAAARAPEGPVGRWLPPFVWDMTVGTDARFVRGVLGALYLVWATQAFVIQRGYQYAHVPETLIMFALWAAHRWAWVPLGLLWIACSTAMWLAADHYPAVKDQLDRISVKTQQDYLPRHPITNLERLKLWPQCWRTNLTDSERYALWDKLRLHPPHEAVISWEELAEVAKYLRDRGAKDGEVVAWFDSPHAVYLILDVEPGFRFMHVSTAIATSIGEHSTGEIGRRKVLDELQLRPQTRFAISDLEWIQTSSGDNPNLRSLHLGPPENPPNQLLPKGLVVCRDEFPFNQPTVFRSANGHGRYIVHEIRTRDDDPARNERVKPFLAGMTRPASD